MSNKVFLVWVNDSVIAVTGSLSTAHLIAHDYRSKISPEGDWRSGPNRESQNRRWWQQNGPVARLEIDEREVQS